MNVRPTDALIKGAHYRQLASIDEQTRFPIWGSSVIRRTPLPIGRDRS